MILNMSNETYTSIVSHISKWDDFFNEQNGGRGLNIIWNFLSLSYPNHLWGKGSIVLSHHVKPLNKPVEKNQREEIKRRKHNSFLLQVESNIC